MYTTDSLHDLRTLNWLDEQRRIFADGSAAAALVEQQQAATRAKMSPSLVSFHLRCVKRGLRSVVPLRGSTCGGCHLKLPSGVLGDLRVPDRYAMCPSCSVFVWSGEKPTDEPTKPTLKKPRTEETFA